MQKRGELLAAAAPALGSLGRAPARRRSGEDRRQDTDAQASQVLNGLANVIDAAEHEILIISPYFVPGQAGARIAGARRPARPARRRADQFAGGHRRRRRPHRLCASAAQVLRGGVELFEMKRKAGSETGRKQLSVTGSSGASLHTKAMLIDRRWVYVGSMNLDPRSAYLNTEMGILADSPELADALAASNSSSARHRS